MTSSQLVVPRELSERRELIRRYHDFFCGTFGFLPDHLPVTGPGVLAGTATGCELVSGQLPSLSGPEVPLPTSGSYGACRRGSPMRSGGHGPPGHVCYDHYVLVIVDCFSRWTEACPLPNKAALAVVDAFSS